MKRSALLAFLLLPIVSLVAGERDARGSSPTSVVLTAGNVRVVIAPNAPKPVRFAADEMTNFLAQVLGGPVAIEQSINRLIEKSNNRMRTVNIVLGTNAWSVAAGLRPEKLPRDSFVTKCEPTTNNQQPTTIFIAGCDDPSWDVRAAWKRGANRETEMCFENATLCGVYDFLERYAGCRFYFDGPLGTIVPKKTSIEVPVGARTESPAFMKRVWYSPGGKLMEGDDLGLGYTRWDECRVGFIQFLRSRRMTATPLVHGIRHMSLRERFGKTHPEYFYATRTKDGKLVRHSDPKDGELTHLCWTSGVIDEIYKDIEAYAKGLPPEARGIRCDPTGGKGVWPRLAYGDGLVAVTPDDGFCACECDACRAAYGTDQRTMASSYASELVWGWTAQLANRVKAAGLPILIEQHAYTFMLKPPKAVELPDNVVVGVAHVGPWAEGAPERQAGNLAEIKTWSAKAGGAKIFMHCWALKFGRTNIADLPCWSPRSVGAYYRRVAPWVKGTYMESSSDRYAHVFLNNYILGKMAWDPSFDYNAAVDEHYELMYGPAAPEMKQFFDALEDCWVGKFTAGKLEYNALGPVQRTPSKFELWRTVYTAEKLAEWQRLFETAEKKVNESNFDSDLYLRRLELMRRNVLEPLAKARQAFADWTDAAKEEARRKREGVRNLLDKEYAFNFFQPESAAGKIGHETESAAISKRIPFKFEPNTTYRLSFFLDAEDIKPLNGYGFTGALVAVFSNHGYHFSFGTGAVTGTTAGRVHQSMILKTDATFKAKEIEVWLRGATGHMKVDGLILEKIK